MGTAREQWHTPVIVGWPIPLGWGRDDGYAPSARESQRRFRRFLLAAAKRREPADEAQLASCLSGLGKNLLRQAKHAEAEKVFAEAVSICERVMTADDWRRRHAQSLLGEAIAAELDRYEEAERSLLDSYAALELHRDGIPSGPAA